ncbi:MAG: phosphoribosylaminoimidazolesuccinocarboxamide synthase [Desulfobacula sp.]|jgi:phosphoribosylaminoimidazole-succinocarboxamide synthase|uniref:phosphoribosylaminoimidazolesuccinocarboxamide synthase n=1 Tax=Desulfobacula sp. TaxID=2593537 RepID=UPI001DE7327E|nr:phosphoribosylaminoimidazolesuccinocarboxamide synthase [Desulfobacula sp.]MBT3484636.1 phosphoribosylaminoimidazolesuccinocarboxamide synthase [Desulfobacula sp.]MBT3806966.1 phosphoribosylaminoimidazolesuccinocarboxamide synthase [Desulfobacula sp.]MBT4023667.1 phosphoribosylaminoimidazolesuccinocarboxamide synthase [Desulfobacula sp.]MBT4200656.1 phosphoribosylaminoimidazolesuccinocarboxamide synthase [Desulfobacula sp.]
MVSIPKTQFDDLSLVRQGKVRDIFDTGESLLMVTTDRLSAFDVVLPDIIPDKGKVLNQISVFWFKQMEGIVNNHIITTNTDEYPEEFKPHSGALNKRSMLVKKAEPLPIECIVRGYITGSGWSSYQKEGHVCGIKLPKGLKESDKLEQPLFTPSTKAEVGDHDINISFDEAVKLIGTKKAEKLKNLSLEIYKKGAEYALSKGIIIADTKFEFGLLDGEIILIDEILTPDSSRFWPLNEYEPGRGQNSFDKQFVRDWLTESGWNKKSPGPKLPQDVIDRTSNTYKEIYTKLTGENV